MIKNFTKAVSQLSDPRVRGILFGSLIGTLALFSLVGTVVVVGLGFLQVTGIAVIDWILQALGGAGVVIFAWFAFPAFIGVIASLFVERVADAVEDRHYPGLPEAAGPGMGASIWLALKFAAVVIGVNLLALPLYLVFIWFPILSFALFLVINGYLLGREYFEMVAFRRMDGRAARTLRKGNRGSVYLAGLMIAALTTIPIVNLLAPVIAAAFMTHVFHSLAPAPAVDG